jgi:formylglycine-generating enzyme required for sulfatase activity
MRFLTAVLALLVLLPAGAAAAQTMLRGGVPVRSELSMSPPMYRTGVPYRCFLISTQRGERWEIQVQAGFVSLITIYARESCDDSTGALASTMNNFNFDRLTFNAGGGTYAVAVRGGINYTAESQVGPFSISARRLSTGQTNGLLQQGVDVIWLDPPRDTASTVSGAPTTRQAGETFRDCEFCPSMVVVGPGSFMMGSPAGEEGRTASEGPRHIVTLNRAFAAGQFEVTFDEYDACVAERACASVQDAGWGRGRRPVINVTFFDALRYVEWLSKRTGQRYFLPSEAEWEYVARAGSDTPWNTGSAIISDDANIQNQFARTVPVGAYPPNAFGLYDIHGNVSEWTLDCSDTGYVGAPTDGSAVRSGNCAQGTAVRGGMYAQEAALVRSAARAFGARNARYTGVGFRVARALEADEAGPSGASDPIAPATGSSPVAMAAEPADDLAQNRPRALAVGAVGFAPAITGRIGCRGVGIDLTRAGDLDEALGSLLEQNLRQRGLYEAGGARMQLTVSNLTVITLGSPAWTLELVATSERFPAGYSVTVDHEFSSHFVADVACRRAEEAFGGALAKGVSAVLDHPDFPRL